MVECFHMMSRRQYWYPKTMKRRPCWCPKQILWELNFFLMQMLSFVSINLHRCWPREWKHSIAQTINAKLLFEILLLESRVYWRNGKLRRLSGRFHTLIWSPGETVQNLESPRLSGRVDAFVAFVETCFCFFKWFLFYNSLKIQWK